MWMDDLRRNMDRKAKADALPDEIRKAHREQYRNVCRDAVKACIIGIAETMTGKPQDKNVQLSECAGQIVDEFERGHAERCDCQNRRCVCRSTRRRESCRVYEYGRGHAVRRCW